MKTIITATQYKQLPERLQKLFTKLYNPSSEEVRECFPETKSGKAVVGTGKGFAENASGIASTGIIASCFADSGNASRFFKSILYYPKASKSERNKGCEELEEKFTTDQNKWTENDYRKGDGEKTVSPTKNNHPTVKSLPLMEYLIKMVTREGGIVFDPFTGSGTTLVAAKKNGFQYLGTEMTDEYIPIIEARLNATEPEEEEIIDKGWFG